MHALLYIIMYFTPCVCVCIETHRHSAQSSGSLNCYDMLLVKNARYQVTRGLPPHIYL